MEQDKYALAVERALFNWYYGHKKDTEATPVFNAIATGLQNDMQVLLPFEMPDEVQKQIDKDLRKLKKGKTKDVCVIKMYEMESNDSIVPRTIEIPDGPNKGKYLIPVFTSDDEVTKGPSVPIATLPLLDVLQSLNNFSGDCIGFIINPWGNSMSLGPKMTKIALEHKPESSITLVRGSVVDMHVGAIVNAANKSLLGGGGVDGAIHKAAGPELLEECRTLHGCSVGHAKITGAYNISWADYIIHTVGPVYSGSSKDADRLSACYSYSLDLALKNHCTSIAFPCISTGVYGYPLKEAAEVALHTIVNWFEEHPDVIMNVYICCFRDAELAAYKSLLRH